jgi:hypothetical protein
MEAACDDGAASSSETSVNFYKITLHATTQKTAIFILTVVKT